MEESPDLVTHLTTTLTDRLSITELEYRRALERGIPVYMFLMSEDHPVIRAGCKWAWADGPTYSHSWELKRCQSVLAALGEPEPNLSAYDPKTARPIPHEAEIRALIAKLKKG